MNEHIPQATINGVTFWPVPSFDDVTAAFGADARAYFDRRNIPDVPRVHEDTVERLFFSGGKLPDDLDPRVDRAKASRAMRAWLASFAPAHEAKIGTAAYALWVWSTPEAIDAAGEPA